MARRVVLAVSQREYAAKLAEYIREEEAGWEIAAFTQVSALRRELQENRSVDLLLVQPEMMHEVAVPSERVGKVMALVEEKGESDGKWREVIQYQPLPGILSEIRGALMGESSTSAKGCQLTTVFSASGGAGKTTVALNLIRQAGQQGLRTFYLNLEALNATSLLFGKGEPDSLSQLLYNLQAHPEQWGEQLEKLCRHQSYLRTDFMDAPEHPGERLALTTGLLNALLEGIRRSGRYDLIVVDPDSGAGEWHRQLLLLSDRVIWLIVDDAQSLKKTGMLLHHWQEHAEEIRNKFTFVLNKGQGGRMVNGWELPGGWSVSDAPLHPSMEIGGSAKPAIGSSGFLRGSGTTA